MGGGFEKGGLVCVLKRGRFMTCFRVRMPADPCRNQASGGLDGDPELATIWLAIHFST